MLKQLILSVFIILFCSCGGTEKTPSNKVSSESKSDLVNKNKPITSIVVRGIGNTMAEMAFDKKEIKVKRGTIVELKLINEAIESSMVHNLVITKKGKADAIGMDAISLKDQNYIPDSPDIIAATDLAKPGETVILNFEAPAPGTYEFMCTFPGHHQKMRGVFIVE